MREERWAMRMAGSVGGKRDENWEPAWIQGPNWVTLLEWIKAKELVEELGLKTSFFSALIGLGAALWQAFLRVRACIHQNGWGSGNVFFFFFCTDSALTALRMVGLWRSEPQTPASPPLAPAAFFYCSPYKQTQMYLEESVPYGPLWTQGRSEY